VRCGVDRKRTGALKKLMDMEFMMYTEGGGSVRGRVCTWQNGGMKAYVCALYACMCMCCKGKPNAKVSEDMCVLCVRYEALQTKGLIH